MTERKGVARSFVLFLFVVSMPNVWKVFLAWSSSISLTLVAEGIKYRDYDVRGPRIKSHVRHIWICVCICIYAAVFTLLALLWTPLFIIPFGHLFYNAVSLSVLKVLNRHLVLNIIFKVCFRYKQETMR